SHTRLEASLYRTDLRDAINYDQTVNRPGNVDNARINGVELSLQQVWAGWTAQLGVSMIDPRDRQSGQTLQRRARRTLNLDLDRQFERFSVGANWQAVSSSYDDPSNNERIGGYGLVGLR
ncbi:TonB-dependent receptor domain-containing protein, partial [Klebsiella pneumoniae]|uniref:TonB-dependent receptor domain-containing protein n=1 Tax=Klebsiella pneumoniae TaxID=573 RepID=UPI003B987993